MHLTELFITRFKTILFSRKILIPLALLIIISLPEKPLCDLSEDAFLFSKLIPQSDMIACGYVNSIEVSSDNYKIYFLTESVLKGENIKEMKIISKLKNGFFLEDESYPGKNKEYILFLKKAGDGWIITNGIAGVYPIDRKDDISKVVSVYNGNQTLFSPGHANDLINLFNSLNSMELKRNLLLDLKKNITIHQAGFIENLFKSNERSFKIFAIQESGYLKISSLKDKIKRLISTNTDNEITFYAIWAIGEYGDRDNLDIIEPFLSSNDQGIRRVSIEALGKIGGEQIISPLLKGYGAEKDLGNRMAIISSIDFLQDRTKVKDAVKIMIEKETNALVLSILNDTLNK